MRALIWLFLVAGCAALSVQQGGAAVGEDRRRALVEGFLGDASAPHRRLQGELLSAGPAAFNTLSRGVGLSNDPEVSRFQQYVATLAPGVLATYFLLGAVLILTTCCCVSACVWCCCLALLPTEVCISLKPTCCL